MSSAGRFPSALVDRAVGHAFPAEQSFCRNPDCGSTTFETVDWSQVRYRDDGFIPLDVVPAPRGARTTMTLRFINEQGTELDRVVFSRTAGT